MSFVYRIVWLEYGETHPDPEHVQYATHTGDTCEWECWNTFTADDLDAAKRYALEFAGERDIEVYTVQKATWEPSFTEETNHA